MKINIKYILGIFSYVKSFVEQSKNAGDSRPQREIAKDMILLRLKYGISVYEYLGCGIGTKSGNEREQAITLLKNKHRWNKEYDENWKFLSKYTGLKWQKNDKTRKKRTQAYIKRYNMGPHCNVQYGVTFISEHYNTGIIRIGDYCLFARDCDIDITGDIEIGDNVGILEGAKVLTHAHDSYHFMKDSDLIPFSNRAYKTNLKIGDNVSICAHAVILPGVGEIGENSIISAGAIVNRPIPANVIVAGNPAQVVRKIPSVVHRTKH